MAVLKKMGYDATAQVQLNSEVGRWVARTGLLSIPPNPQPSPVQYWESIALILPMLAKVALTVFAINPSEASVERSFSHQSLVHSDLRSSLGDATIDAHQDCVWESSTSLKTS